MLTGYNLDLDYLFELVHQVIVMAFFKGIKVIINSPKAFGEF